MFIYKKPTIEVTYSYMNKWQLSSLPNPHLIPSWMWVQLKIRRPENYTLTGGIRPLFRVFYVLWAWFRTHVVPFRRSIVYAQSAKCLCGAFLAYDNNGPSGNPSNGYWDCAHILWDTADPHVIHSAQKPFAFHRIEAE